MDSIAAVGPAWGIPIGGRVYDVDGVFVGRVTEADSFALVVSCGLIFPAIMRFRSVRSARTITAISSWSARRLRRWRLKYPSPRRTRRMLEGATFRSDCWRARLARRM
jgi:hypothetical protein